MNESRGDGSRTVEVVFEFRVGTESFMMRQSRVTFWHWLTALCIGLGGAWSVTAAEVTVVLTSDAVPYQQAYAAIAKRLAENQHRATQLLLVQLQKDPTATVINQLNESAAVIAVGTPAAVTLQQHAQLRAPLFYCLVANPAESGLLVGRANEGVTTTIPLTAQFQLIQRALPNARHVGMLYRSGHAASAQLVTEVRESLPAGWQLTAMDVPDQNSVADSINSLLERDVQVVWAQPDAGIYQQATVRTLLLASLRKRVPIFGFSVEMVRAGSLLGVGVEPAMQGMQAAELVVSRLNDPSSLPLQQHRVVTPLFKSAVNLIVAERLRITLAEEVRQSADRIFKQGDE